MEFMEWLVRAARMRKVADELTREAEAFHGTPGGFEVFEHDRSGLGTHFGTWESADERLRRPLEYEDEVEDENGDWHTETGVEDEYQDEIPDDFEIRRYDLEIRKPLRLRDVGLWNDKKKVADVLASQGLLSEDEMWSMWQVPTQEAWTLMRRKIEEAGYDSVTYKNAFEDVGEDSYIVWDNSKIKLLDQHVPESPRLSRNAQMFSLHHPEHYDDLPIGNNKYFENFFPLDTRDTFEGEDRFPDLDGSEPLGREDDALHPEDGLVGERNMGDSTNSYGSESGFAKVDAGAQGGGLTDLSQELRPSTDLDTTQEHTEDATKIPYGHMSLEAALIIKRRK